MIVQKFWILVHSVEIPIHMNAPDMNTSSCNRHISLPFYRALSLLSEVVEVVANERSESAQEKGSDVGMSNVGHEKMSALSKNCEEDDYSMAVKAIPMQLWVEHLAVPCSALRNVRGDWHRSEVLLKEAFFQ